MVAFCTVEDLETALGMDAANPLVAEASIEHVSAAIRGELDQELELDGSRVYALTARPYSTVLLLPEAQVNAITSVVEDGTTLVEATDYLWRPSGILERIGNRYWSSALGGVVVTCSTGYAPGTPKGDLLRAVTRAAALRAYQNAMRSVAAGGASGIQSESLAGDYTQTFAVDLGGAYSMLLLPSERAMLRRAFTKGRG